MGSPPFIGISARSEKNGEESVPPPPAEVITVIDNYGEEGGNNTDLPWGVFTRRSGTENWGLEGGEVPPKRQHGSAYWKPLPHGADGFYFFFIHSARPIDPLTLLASFYAS